MTVISEEQRKKIQYLIQRLTEAQADVWEAFETTFMSDAKSAVFQLRSKVNEDQSLDPIIKEQLMTYLDEAWSAIIGPEETYRRAQKSHSELAKAVAYLKDISGH
ncbi:MAG: hypothetical protein GY795_03815 [Desulfobacterales bacterium]|nr:hypothetical protein [Desulfobacterales bacterium]